VIVELHMLQNFAPSCLNRDDTNTPKDCEFGGYRRARISSQCIKYAVRKNLGLRAEFEGMFALRSNDHALQIADVVSKRNEGSRPFEQARQIARYMFQRMGFKEKNGRLTVMLLLGADEIKKLADKAIENWEHLAPLANETFLRGRLAERIAGFLGDDEDAAMLGKLIANFKTDGANAKQLDFWLKKNEDEWSASLVAARELTEEKLQELRGKYHVEAEDAERGDEVDDDEFVPKAAAKLFKMKPKGGKNLLIEALKVINVDRDAKGGPKAGDDEAASASSKALKPVFAGLKKLTTTALNAALFGRMLAEIKTGDMNVDAACQVAHALSTNTAAIEMDYFTAVEELKDLAREHGEERNSGAGMIGSVEFNSGSSD
jgi:hypothetical protein